MDDNGMACLHFARSEVMVEYLISKGANVNPRAKDQTTPLHFASTQATAAILIKNGANMEAKDLDGSTPLHWAVSSRVDVAKTLIMAGAPINQKDLNGSTPLDYASDEIKVLLLKNGAKPGSELTSMRYNLAKHELSIHGISGNKYEVQYSSDLNNWVLLETSTLEKSFARIVDKDGISKAKRFYRLKAK